MTAMKSAASIFPNFNRILTTLFCIVVFSPQNFIEHGHEDDSVGEVLRFTLYTFHDFLNLFEDASRCEPWDDFPLEFRLHAIDAIHDVSVDIWRWWSHVASVFF